MSASMMRDLADGTGYALGGTSVSENQLDPYIQEAIDQVTFLLLALASLLLC
jgi:hypothetical protein